MFWSNKKIEKLQKEFDQYKYDQENKPQYYVGQLLSDGTTITKVQKIEYYGIYVKKYKWIYEGVRNGTVVENFKHVKVNISDFKELKSQLFAQQELILKLQWQINNKPKYSVGEKVNVLGTLEKIDILNKIGINAIIGPKYYYQYTFKNKNKTIAICE